MDTGTEDQRQVCARYGADFVPTPQDAIVGCSKNVGGGLFPLNGLRHRIGGTSGWFIWSGTELSDAPDFFEPVHARHLDCRCPDAVQMLGLSPGWRFLIAPGQVDVWFDATLLDHEA